MTSFKKVTWAPFALSAGIDLLAVALIASGQRYLQSYLGAVAIHLVAVCVVVKFDDRLLGSRRGLAAALTLALPLAGAGLAAIALCTRPQAGLVAAIAVDYVEPPMLDAACFQKIATALSPCEVLSAPASEASSATLAALTRRGDGESVKLLRWLVIANPEMAVDAALALEELSMRFDAGLELRRRDLALAPSAESAFATAAFIARAMHSGLVDPVMLNVRAAEARRCFALARDLAPTGADDVTLAWARMELLAVHPETALAMVEEQLTRPSDSRRSLALIELRDEARFASHGRFDRALGSRPSDTQARLAA